ncbi:MAG: HD domain-containing protein [Clostridia bacterium]|nr:HD domain-containing protein [Clostridia bacterium]
MDIIDIAKKIEQNNGRLYFVGGYVRDLLLGTPSHDIDFCVTGLNEDTFLKLFPNAIKTGASFPVFRIDSFEFAFARKEQKTSAGHNGFTMDTNNITIFDDLVRRDITINSIAMDVLTNEIIDPTGGQKDLKEKIIRANSEHFSEDALRSYRVARFASKLQFNVDESTIKLMHSTKNELPLLSSERVFEELKKALLTPTPSIFFNVLRKADILDVHFKEIYDLIDVPQPLIYHPEGDVYNHSMIVLDECSKITDDALIKFAALTHDLGKALTPKEILPHHYGHDEVGCVPVKNLCNRLKVPNEWEKTAIVVSREHMKAGIWNDMSVSKKVSFMEKNYKYLKVLNIIAKIDSGKNDIDFVSIADKMMHEVNGEKIDLPNDIRAKEILHQKRIEWLKK